jgi:homoserine O-acetyltransferase
MTDARHGVHLERNFALSGGASLPEAQAAYVTMGELDDERSNAVMVMHGYTSSHTFIERGSTAAEGSWSDLIGPGKAIDTDRFFVVCSNALGSSYGSTGPSSIDPGTGAPYGPDFPAIAFADIARLQKSMLAAFGIERLCAVAGVSMGGFQAVQWAVQYPESTDKIAVVLSALDGKRPAAGAEGLRARLRSHPRWNDGRHATGELQDVLTLLRVDTLRNYGMDTWLKNHGHAADERATLLHGMAAEWAASFDPNSMLTLMGAMQTFDATPMLRRMKARVLLVLCSSDLLFPASLREPIVKALDDNRIEHWFHELKSPYGHLASGLDWQLWSEVLREFIDTPGPGHE